MLEPLRVKVEDREYYSIVPLAEDIARVIREKVGVLQIGDNKVKQTPEQKHIKQRASIILTKVRPILMDAARKEAELGYKSPDVAEEEAQRVLVIMQNALKSGPASTIPSVTGAEDRDEETTSRRGSAQGLTNGTTEAYADADADGDVDMADASVPRNSDAPNNIGGPTTHEEMMIDGIKLDFEPNADADQALHVGDDANDSVPALSNSGSTNPSHGQVDPPTPPHSDTKDLLAPLVHGGIPWYLEQFDPQGTTIHDEEWSGREVLRDLSEELSELDEEALNELVDEDMHRADVVKTDTLQVPVANTKRKAAKRKGRAR